MSYSFYHVIHLISLFILTGVVFSAITAPVEEARKFYLKVSGIFSLLAFISGFGLLAKLGIGFSAWLIVKIVCWLVLTAIVGLVFRKPEKTRGFLICAIVVVSLAVAMVSLKPSL